MPRFTLHEVREPHRRIAQVTTDVDPKSEADCVALLRRLAAQHKRKPGDVLLRWTGGQRVVEYRA